MSRPSTTPKKSATPPQHAEHVIDFREHQKLAEAGRVGALLARRGLCDKAIARETGLELRQVKRIISAYRIALRVDTRTQVALKLAGFIEKRIG